MSRYQSSTTTTKYNANDNRLDELLEDLQSTVARPNKLNGTAGSKTSGYREVIKTSSSQKNGLPAETSRQYEFESLGAPERPKSPFDKEHTNGAPGKSVKTVSYEYNSSKRSGSHTSGGTPVVEKKFEKLNGKPEVKFRENINELDTLLDDLNHTQKQSEYSSSSSSHMNRYKNYDSGFIEPLDHSTPQKSSHVSKFEQKSFEERHGNASPIRHTEIKKEVYQDGQPVEKFVDKYSSGGNDMKKDLVFTGGSFRHREPSPARQHHQEMHHYETKSSSSKKSAEVPPPRTVSRHLNYGSDVTDHAIPHHRSPSPTRREMHQQHYSSSNTVKESTTTQRSPSPVRSYYSTTSTVTRNLTPQPTRHVFSANKSIQERRETSSRRSPSPIEPLVSTSTNSYNYERSVRPQEPLPLPSREIPPGATIITRNYKYSSESRKNTTYPAQPIPYEPPVQPFPSPSPKPEIKEQNPPKQLDELMASFSDSESHYKHSYNAYSDRYHSSERVQSKSPTPPKTPDKIIPVQAEKTYECKKTNGVAGPPVYYPPGPLFSKKEECSMMEEKNKGKGRFEANREAMYKYEAGGKMKEKSDRKKTVVPLCAPVCCALPCTIM